MHVDTEELLVSLTSAVASGRTDIVRSIISAAAAQHNQGGGDSGDVTADATSDDSLLENVLNVPIDSNGTLLHLATRLDHPDIVRTLMSAGACPSIRNEIGQTPLDVIATDSMALVYADELFKAAAVSDTKRMRDLVESGVSVNVKDSPSGCNTPLHWAASYGNEEAVRFLIDCGADVNATNSLGCTPLHDAVSRANGLKRPIVERLLVAGADYNIRATKGKYASLTPLDIALKDTETRDLFLKHCSSFQEDQIQSKRRLSVDSLISQDSSVPASLSALTLDADPTSSQHQMAPHMPSSSELHVISDARLNLLWPRPQKILQIPGQGCTLPKELTVGIVQHLGVGVDVMRLWDVHAPWFLEAGYTIHMGGIVPPLSSDCDEFAIVCHVNPLLFSHQEAFRLHLLDSKVRVTSASVAGMHYGLCTLLQLLHLCVAGGDEPIPALLVEDWPTTKHRGILLDFSSDAPVPTLESLKCLVDQLSKIKMNQLHLHHRFSASDAWQFPYATSDLLQLMSFCSDRFVSLIPAIDLEPFLSSGDLAIVTKAIEGFLAYFDNTSIVHVGPNLANVAQLRHLCPRATLLIGHSEDIDDGNDLVSKLAGEVAFADYGCKRVNHADFSEGPCKTIVEKGAAVWVCPSIGIATNLVGHPEASMQSLWQAARAASLHNACGYVVCGWCGVPPLAPLCFSWPGMTVGVGLAWNPNVHLEFLQAKASDLVDVHLAKDEARVVGSAIIALGKVEAYLQHASEGVDAPKEGRSLLLRLLTRPDDVCLENLTDDTFQTAVRHVKQVQVTLPGTKASCAESAQVLSEIKLVGDLILFACRLGRQLVSTGRNPSSDLGVAVINAGISNLPTTARTDLANKLLCLMERFRSVWWCRHLPSGLRSSLLAFNTLLRNLLPDAGVDSL